MILAPACSTAMSHVKSQTARHGPHFEHGFGVPGSFRVQHKDFTLSQNSTIQHCTSPRKIVEQKSRCSQNVDYSTFRLLCGPLQGKIRTKVLGLKTADGYRHRYNFGGVSTDTNIDRYGYLYPLKKTCKSVVQTTAEKIMLNGINIA